MQSYWFGDFDGTDCLPAPDDPFTLVKRIKVLSEVKEAPLPDWEIAVRCGFVNDRVDYLNKLQRTAIAYSGQRLEEIASADASGLVQMVRMVDQIDEAINLLIERAVDWYQGTHHGFRRKSARTRGMVLVTMLRNDADGAFLDVLDEIDRLTNLRKTVTHEVAGRAEREMPNSSALVGGLVAARLAAEAGGIRELAMMPASSLQVLGAKKALFAHLTTGSPPPKHGVVYQHSRVHGSRKEQRGRVSRVLAAKLSIAVRIDYYRKEPDPAFIRSATEAIRKAGAPP
jgi:nucleolar protein 56